MKTILMTATYTEHTEHADRAAYNVIRYHRWSGKTPYNGTFTTNLNYRDENDTSYSRLICQAEACCLRAHEWLVMADACSAAQLAEYQQYRDTANNLLSYAVTVKKQAERMKVLEVDFICIGCGIGGVSLITT